MDYSDLVYAVRNGDHKTVSRRVEDAFPILRNYLVSKLGARHEDAEDAVQKMFEYVIPKIKRNEIISPEGLLSYMLIASRHSYMNSRRSIRKDDVDYLSEKAVSPPNQVWNLIEEDREKILLDCLSRLRDHYKSLIVFLFEYPNSVPEDMAEYFGISLNNVWIRKHRAVKQLSECVEKFM